MVNQVFGQRRFLVEWTISNIIGFMIGSLLGATNGGLVTAALGDTLLAKVVGDVLFSAAFGLAQVIIFWRHFPESRGRLWWWVIASIIGFTVGVRMGARFAPQIAPLEPWLGLVFGLVVGSCLGVVEWAAMRWAGALKVEAPIGWIPASILAWMIGEMIAFSSDFNQGTVPLVAIAIAVTSGVALVRWVRPH